MSVCPCSEVVELTVQANKRTINSSCSVMAAVSAAERNIKHAVRISSDTI
jgi:hypothetical protein